MYNDSIINFILNSHETKIDYLSNNTLNVYIEKYNRIYEKFGLFENDTNSNNLTKHEVLDYIIDIRNCVSKDCNEIDYQQFVDELDFIKDELLRENYSKIIFNKTISISLPDTKKSFIQSIPKHKSVNITTDKYLDYELVSIEIPIDISIGDEAIYDLAPFNVSSSRLFIDRIKDNSIHEEPKKKQYSNEHDYHIDNSMYMFSKIKNDTTINGDKIIKLFKSVTDTMLSAIQTIKFVDNAMLMNSIAENYMSIIILLHNLALKSKDINYRTVYRIMLSIINTINSKLEFYSYYNLNCKGDLVAKLKRVIIIISDEYKRRIQ